MSILARLILLVVLALAPVIAVQAVNAVDLRRNREAELHSDALRHAEVRNGTLDGIVEGVRRLLVAVAHLPAVRSFDPARCDALLETLAKEYPHDITLSAVGTDGVYFCSSSSPRNAAAWAGDQAFFRETIASGTFTVGNYAENRLSGGMMLSFGYPIRDNGGKIVGVLSAGLTLSGLAGYLERSPMPPGWSLTVTDRNGVVLVHLPRRRVRIGHRLPEAQLRMIGNKAPGVVEAKNIEGRPTFYGYVPPTVAPDGIYVLSGIDRQVGMAAVETASWRSAVLSLVSVALGLLIAWIVGVRMIRAPAQQLLRAVRRWQAGEYGVRSGLRPSTSEIAEIGAAFDGFAEKLQLRDQQLAAANRAKDIVLASAGHDLRQPLQVITLALAVLSRKTLSAGERQHVERADAAIDRLGSALDTLIDASRVQYGAVQPHRRFPIGGLLRELRDEWAPRAEEKGLRFRVVRSSAAVESDRERLRTILHNLINNAIKYTERGTVLVGCRRRGDKLAVAVHDTGIGIPEDAIDTAFGEFKQLDPLREGYGLGLWIVRGTAAALGHPVSVRSRVGKGSCFEILLPLADAAHAREAGTATSAR